MRFIVFDHFPDEDTKCKLNHLKTLGEVIVFASFDYVGEIKENDIVIISDRWFCGYCCPWYPSQSEIFQIMEKIQKTNEVFRGDFDARPVVFDGTRKKMDRYENITFLIGCWPVKEYWKKEEEK